MRSPFLALVRHRMTASRRRRQDVGTRVFTIIMLTKVAGIMVYISPDELLPTSRAYDECHDSLFDLIAGMAVMAMSLLLLW
jgi:zinc transporter ZupT